MSESRVPADERVGCFLQVRVQRPFPHGRWVTPRAAGLLHAPVISPVYIIIYDALLYEDNLGLQSVSQSTL